MLFKIFPEHLDLGQIFSVVREQRPEIILLLRNPLDSFISYKKLVETKKPQDVDTSGLQIKFDKAEYFTYKASLASYFNAIKQFCEDEWLNVTVSHYEWLHDSTTDNKPDMVRKRIQQVFGTPMKELDNAAELALFKRQDTSSSAREKVLNPAELPQQPQFLLA